MSDFDTVDFSIRLNNEAITRLLIGDHATAIELLAKSISCLRRLASVTTDAQKGHSFHHVVAPFDLRSRGCKPSGSDVVGATLFQTIGLPFLSNFHFHIFNKAIVLAENFSRTQASLNTISACIIYNLSLSHHQWGLRHHQRHDSILRKGERLYNWVDRLIKDPSFPNDDVSALLELAVANNTAQIRFDRGNQSEHYEDFETLGTHIRYVQSSNLARIFQENDWNRLIGNLRLLSSPQVAAAA